MLRFDETTLDELGLGELPPEEKKRLLTHVREVLEKRVGIKLVAQMSQEQLKEFEVFMNSNDQEGARVWLDTNIPQYKQVVHQELDVLKSEIKQDAATILASIKEQDSETVQ